MKKIKKLEKQMSEVRSLMFKYGGFEDESSFWYPGRASRDNMSTVGDKDYES